MSAHIAPPAECATGGPSALSSWPKALSNGLPTHALVLPAPHVRGLDTHGYSISRTLANQMPFPSVPVFLMSSTRTCPLAPVHTAKAAQSSTISIRQPESFEAFESQPGTSPPRVISNRQTLARATLRGSSLHGWCPSATAFSMAKTSSCVEATSRTILRRPARWECGALRGRSQAVRLTAATRRMSEKLLATEGVRTIEGII